MKAHCIVHLYNNRTALFILLSVLCGTMHGMQQLDKRFEEVVTKKQRKLQYIPQNFDQTKHGRIIQYDTHDGFNIVVTVLGGMYCSDGDTWFQVHANEYENEEQFCVKESSLFPNRAQFAFWYEIEKQKFPLYNYDPATKVLAYPTHQQEKHKRTNKVLSYSNHRTTLYPKRIRFECESPKIACEYDMKLNDNAGNIDYLVHDSTGTYYAIAGTSNVIPQTADSDQKDVHRSFVKILKKISDTDFGDDPNDLLTQGDDETKTFILKTKVGGQCLDMCFHTHAYGNHLHLLMDKENLKRSFETPNNKFLYWIISPIYGKTAYKAFIDCGNKLLPFEIVNHFSQLKYLLCKSKPKICVRADYTACVVEALTKMLLPRELRQKIIYDYCMYPDKKLIQNTYIIYGADDITFPKDQKEALALCNDLYAYIHTGGKDTPHFLETYSDTALWDTLYHWYHWTHNVKVVSQLLANHMFTKIQLSKDNDFLVGSVGKLTQTCDGQLLLYRNSNSIAKEVQASFSSVYHGFFNRRKDWGIKEDMEKYVHDKTIKEVIKTSGVHFVAVCNDDTKIDLW